jgi:hypothetical protein
MLAELLHSIVGEGEPPAIHPHHLPARPVAPPSASLFPIFPAHCPFLLALALPLFSGFLILFAFLVTMIHSRADRCIIE